MIFTDNWRNKLKICLIVFSKGAYLISLHFFLYRPGLINNRSGILMKIKFCEDRALMVERSYLTDFRIFNLINYLVKKRSVFRKDAKFT